MSKVLMILFLQILLPLIQSSRSYSIPLSGAWSLTDGIIIVHFNLTSTGTDVYSVLKEKGVIKNPLSGYGDTDLRYISYKNWTFSHYFQINHPEVLKTTFLEIDEVDAFCCIYLNKYLLTCTENSFIRTTLPIDNSLQNGFNVLQFIFKSTPLMAKEAYKKNSPNPPLPACWPDIFKGECYINVVRTTQASFGWDWGPSFPIQGFWKLPLLRFGERWLGDGLRFFPVKTKHAWKAAVSVEVLSSIYGAGINRSACVYVRLGGGLMYEWITSCASLQGNETNLWLKLPLASNATVRPWWPNGVQTGPYLYSLKVQLRSLDGRLLIDNRSFWVGFRQAELVQEDVKINERAFGKTFFFRINGEAMFVRGSNWVTQSLFTGDSAVTKALLLRSAKIAGIQMLRVWGGGRYEDRRFYDLAGRLGIMIWQDMMFACAMYKKPPIGEVDSVETEVRQQVRRLHHHPAIVVWATNNEVEVAAAHYWYGPKVNRQDYSRRFLQSVAPIVRGSEAPPVHYAGYIPRRVLLSSPSNADSSIDPYGIDPNPQSPLSGDVHFYSYHDDLWNECTYPVTRFTSEYGIMSLPGPLAWLQSFEKSSSQPDDWMIRGDLMMHRSHIANGINILQGYVREKFGGPIVSQSEEETYYSWAYLTQLYQAIAYKTHINHLERHRCTISIGNLSNDCANLRLGQGISMGHLYWQLNDVWAAPTWSTIDVTGQWKIAHYVAIRGTASITHPIGRVILSQVKNRVLINWIPPINPFKDNRIHLRVICSPITSFFLRPKILFQSFDNIGPWKSNSCPLKVTEFALDWLLSVCPFGVVTTILENGVEQTNDTSLLLTPKEISSLWPPTAGLVSVVSVRRVNTVPFSVPRPPFRWDQAFKILLRAKSPELFVWLLIDPYTNLNGWFSNNAFHMLTHRELDIFYYAEGSSTILESNLQKAIRLYTLASIKPAGRFLNRSANYSHE